MFSENITTTISNVYWRDRVVSYFSRGLVGGLVKQEKHASQCVRTMIT